MKMTKDEYIDYIFTLWHRDKLVYDHEYYRTEKELGVPLPAHPDERLKTLYINTATPGKKAKFEKVEVK